MTSSVAVGYPGVLIPSCAFVQFRLLLSAHHTFSHTILLILPLTGTSDSQSPQRLLISICCPFTRLAVEKTILRFGVPVEVNVVSCISLAVLSYISNHNPSSIYQSLIVVTLMLFLPGTMVIGII